MDGKDGGGKIRYLLSTGETTFEGMRGYVVAFGEGRGKEKGRNKKRGGGDGNGDGRG